MEQNVFFLTILNPLDQFEIRDFISINAPLLFNLNISLTNIAFYLIIGGLINVNFSSIDSYEDCSWLMENSYEPPSIDLLHKSWDAPLHPPNLGDARIQVPTSNWGARGAKIE